MTNLSIDYYGRTIQFQLLRKQVKNINLNVKPDMSIMVSANETVSVEKVKDFIFKKGDWIIKQLNYFNQFQPNESPPKEYVSGESFKYLGKQYRLKVYPSDKDRIRYFRGWIQLFTKTPKDRDKKARLIQIWYSEKTKIQFRAAMDRVYPLMEEAIGEKPQLKIRQMKTRWGSCLKKDRTIVLNNDLIKAPKFCIDYVVLHELLHFIHRNHDRAFLLYLTALMPDWQERKRILDEEVVRDL